MKLAEAVTAGARTTSRDYGVFIPCSHCDGAGRIRLTGVHADTLAFLKTQAKALNGAELARLCGVEPTAMNNRLIWLEKYGFAKSERYGSQKRWRAV